MNLRTPLLNGTFSPHMHSCRRQSPRLLSLSFQPIVAVEARRGLLSTPFPRDQQQSSTFNKDAGSTSTSPSLLKVCNLAAPHTGHIRIITLNSPRNKNALSLQLLAELEAELHGIQVSRTRSCSALILPDFRAIFGFVVETYHGALIQCHDADSNIYCRVQLRKKI